MNLTSLLNWILLSTVLLGVWWLCYRVALRQERSFVYNRVFLVLGPVLAASLPLLPLAWPSGWGAVPAALPSVTTVLLPAAQVGGPAATGPTGVDWSFWLWAAYLGGAALLLGRLETEMTKLWLATRALAQEKRAGYTLVPTHGQLPTSSFGRVVLWDETLPLSAAEAAQVLRHELAHMRQGHTYDRLLLELLRAALWFNPFVHYCGRALALTHEYLADEAALQEDAVASFSATRSYAHLLARQVATRLGFSVPLTHTFSHSQTLRRIAMIQKTSPIRRWKQWLALPLMAASLFIVAACERQKEVAPASTFEVRNERLVNGAWMTDSAAVPPPPPPAPVPPDAPLRWEREAYVYVEQMPQLPGGGGNTAIVQAIQKNLVYPEVPAANRKAGRVFVSFMVTETGEVRDALIVKGLSSPYDNAVLDAVRNMPRFVPGKQDGKTVPVRFTVPVQFLTETPAKTVGLQLFNLYGGWEPKLVRTGC